MLPNLTDGATQLSPWFSKVLQRDYENALLITEVGPLVDYILSTKLMSEDRRTELVQFVEQEMAAHGSIHISKEVGLFIAYRDTGES